MVLQFHENLTDTHMRLGRASTSPKRARSESPAFRDCVDKEPEHGKEKDRLFHRRLLLADALAATDRRARFVVTFLRPTFAADVDDPARFARVDFVGADDFLLRERRAGSVGDFSTAFRS